MGNAVLGMPRLTDYYTLTGGSYESAWPLSNAASLPLSQVAITTNLAEASTQFVATSTVGLLPARMFGFCHHNMSLYAKRRMKFFSDTARSQLVYDTDWGDVWPTAYSVYEDNFLRPNFFSGKYSPDEIAGQSPPCIVWLPDVPPSRAIEIYLRDPDNEDARISFGLFEIATGSQLSVNFGMGSRFGIQLLDQEVVAEGGGLYIEDRQAKRMFSGSINYLPMDEAKSGIYELLRQHKKRVPFLWLPNPDDTKHRVRDAWLARFSEAEMFDYAAYARAGVTLNLEEVTVI